MRSLGWIIARVASAPDKFEGTPKSGKRLIFLSLRESSINSLGFIKKFLRCFTL